MYIVKRMSDSERLITMSNFRGSYLKIQIFLISITPLIITGCTPTQEAVELYVEAVRLAEADEKVKAIEKLETSLELYEHFSLAHSMLGEIYYDMKDYRRSVRYYKKATDLNPWSFRDYFNLGGVYYVMKEHRKAANAYVNACEIKPEHFQAHINAAKSYYEIKNFNSAMQYAERAESIYPGASEVQKILGDIFEFQKDHEQAIRAYKRSLEIDSDNPDTMLALAVAYLRDNRTNSAKELLISVTQIQPENNAAFQYLGYCYLQLKEIDKSIQNYSRAIAIDKRDWQAYRGLGVAYMLIAINDEDDVMEAKALHQWRRSLEIKPDQPRRERLYRLIEKYTQ